jgi:hypothetical protein
MDQALTLFPYRFPSLISRGRFGHRAQNFLLGHVPSSARGRELVFKNGDPLGSLGSMDPCHYYSRLCSSHLLLKLCHLSHVLG